MELTVLKVLLDDIAQFGLLCSTDIINDELVQRYYHEIDGYLKHLKIAFDEMTSPAMMSEVQSGALLQEIDSALNKAKDLIYSWHPMMSKIYFVLQIEKIITKLEELMLDFFQLLSSPLSSLKDSSVKALEVHHESVSVLIFEAIRDQMETSTPRPELLVKISNFLSLSTNQELLIEVVALEKLKVRVGRGENYEVENIEHMIDLVNYMYDCLVKVKRAHNINGVPIPADFCCSLSLELMSDPVIVASGQTYERAFIRNWLDQGFNVCPKTRQTLGHTNLIPNFTVKALIANWCESNNIKLPDPIKSASSIISLPFISQPDPSVSNSSSLQSGHSPKLNRSRSPEPNTNVFAQPVDSYSYNGIHQESYNTDKESSDYSLSGASPAHITNEGELLMARWSLVVTTDEKMNSSMKEKLGADRNQIESQSKQDYQPNQVDEKQLGHSRSASSSGAISSHDHREGTGSPSVVSGDLTHYSSDTSREVGLEVPLSSSPIKESDFLQSLGETRSRSQNTWRHPSVPRVVPSPSINSRTNLLAVETQVRKLIEDLQSESIDVLRTATSELRLLAKHSMENRIILSNCGSIHLLVSLLRLTDSPTQENAVTALLNLSINDNNKIAIANADAIDPLIHVLETGSPEAKENAAATLFSLSVIEENKVKIGRSRAIKPLVELLGNGTPRGKKDASTALFNLSIFHENKARIVQAGAVRYLVELMDPAFGMVDKAVAVLANLSTIAEGRTAISHANGIPVLVEVVELGSARGKENAAAALLQLCTNSSKFCSLVLQEGAVPPLVALSQSGTPRAKEKAQALLSYFRSQRHANAGRS